MWTRQHRKRNTGRLIVPVLALVVSAYFGFHAFTGTFGLKAKTELDARANAASAELLALQAERARIEARNTLLQDGSVEKDMLDEQVRRSLSMARSDELIVLLPLRQVN